MIYGNYRLAYSWMAVLGVRSVPRPLPPGPVRGFDAGAHLIDWVSCQVLDFHRDFHLVPMKEI